MKIYSKLLLIPSKITDMYRSEAAVEMINDRRMKGDMCSLRVDFAGREIAMGRMKEILGWSLHESSAK